jgi:hydrogenase maturation factor HypF (carbamoyltransferase family)
LNRTVDLISYTVSVLKPVTELDEAAPGSGGLCGSTFLNRIFAKYMRDRFESHPDWEEEILKKAMKQFESDVKKTFQGDPEDEAIIPIHPIRESSPAKIIRGDLYLPSKVISEEIFDPVIDEIIKLVKNQIRATKKTVKAVLLVGGFGENSYLRRRIQKEIGERIRVIPGHQG